MKPSTLVAYILGAATGATATWYFLKKKYEQLAQEEIESVKEVFAARAAADTETSNDISDEGVVKCELVNTTEALAEIEKTVYKNYAKAYNNGVIKEDDVEKPYVISPEEFGELDDYETVSLSFYEDGVLADDDNNVIDSVDEIIGEESLTHFGEYESDAVHVRNDKLQCDYEILMVLRTFADTLKTDPHDQEV